MPTIVLEPPSKDKEKSEKNSDSSTNKEQEEEDDPVTTAIKKTGCYPLHEKLQECYFDKKDWRACSDVMQEFRQCMAKNSTTENQKAKK